MRSKSLMGGLRTVALTGVSLVLLAGCGSDNSSDKAGGSAAGAGTAATTAAAAAPAGKVSCGLSNGKKATGAAIEVGAIVGATGPADFSSAAKGAKAYFDCINDNGGINGRPVDYLVEDDGWDPAKAAQAARKLVEDKHVVALIGSTSFVECGANAKYYEQQQILVVAGVGVPRECFHSRNISPTNQGPRLSGIGAAQFAEEQGAKSISCVANVIPNFGGWVCDGIEAWGKRAGVSVKSFHGKPDASDADAIMLKAINADTDAIVLVDAGPSMVPYLKAAQQQDTKTPIYLPTSAYELSFPKAVGSYWNGKLHAQIELSELDSTGPDNTAWQGVMKEYGGDAPRDSFSQAGFLAAKIFTDALQGAKGEITRQTATAALQGVKDYKTDLTCGPWYFGDAAEHNANHAGKIVVMQAGGTGFKTVKDCFEVEDPDLDAIRASEKS
jgi:branched-chain amino acid transport system substrate-binding protein